MAWINKISFRINLIGVLLILLSTLLCASVFVYYTPEGREIALSPFITISSAILYFITGLGLMRRKKWSRIFGIGLLLLFVLFCGIYIRFFLSFVMLELSTLQEGAKIFFYPPPNNYRDMGPFITIRIFEDILLPGIFIFFALVSLLFIYYLCCPKTKEQFNK